MGQAHVGVGSVGPAPGPGILPGMEEAGDGSGIDAAWRRLEQEEWTSDEAHRRFIARCALHGALDQAGRRYRAVRDADPTRREDAARRLDAVMAAAMEQLSQTRSPGPAPKRRIMWLMVGACGFLILQAVLALLRRGSH
jgi:hypothetical protein